MIPLRPAMIATTLAGALAFPASSESGRMMTIVLGSHYFQPSPIHLKAGVPVRMVFVNRAGKTHDFTAPAFFAASRIRAGNPRGGEIELKKGQSAIVDLIPRRGTYRVHCGQFLHGALGMKTRIIVS